MWSHFHQIIFAQNGTACIERIHPRIHLPRVIILFPSISSVPHHLRVLLSCPYPVRHRALLIPSAEIPLEFLAFSTTLQLPTSLSTTLPLILTTKVFWMFPPRPTSLSLSLLFPQLYTTSIYREDFKNTQISWYPPPIKTYCSSPLPCRHHLHLSFWCSNAPHPPGQVLTQPHLYTHQVGQSSPFHSL